MRLNAIQFAITAEDLIRALQSGLTDPTDLYAETLSRIRGQHHQKAQLAFKVLAWLSLVKRPLTIRELCHALGIQLCKQEFSRTQIPAPETVLSSCFGLVIQDRHNDRVRLLHYTLLEFLEQNNLFDFGHQKVLETCLKCLSVPEIEKLSLKVRTTPSRVAAIQMQILRAYPFSEYAAIHWFTHMSVESETLDCLLVYLTSSDKLIAWLRLLNFHDPKKYRQTFQIPFFSHDPSSDSCIGIRMAVAMRWHEVLPLIFARKEYSKLEMDAMLVTVLENKALDFFETLLAHGLDPCYRDADGVFLLHRTVALNLPAGVTSLAKHGADLNQRNSHQQTPLQIALGLDTRNCSRVLIQYGADTNIPDFEGNTALHIAVMSGASESFVRTLLSHGSQTNTRNISGLMPIHLALSSDRRRSSQEAVVRLLLEYGSPDDALAVNSYILLHHACIWSWSFNTISLILGQFALNSRCNQEGENFADSPDSSANPAFTLAERSDLLSLSATVSFGSNTHAPHEEESPSLHFQQSIYSVIFQSILRCKISIYGVDSDGRTPLHYAVLTNRPYLARFLLQAGVNANHQDHKRETALHLAVLNMVDEEMVNTLLDHGVDALATDTNGRSALELALTSASSAGILSILSVLPAQVVRMSDGSSFLIGAILHRQPIWVMEKLLCLYPGEIDSRCGGGDTALELAIHMAQPDVLEFLLRNGADVSIVDPGGDPVLHRAVILRSPRASLHDNSADNWTDCIDILLEYGADVNQTDSISRTALQIAIDYKVPPGQIKKISDRTLRVDSWDKKGSSPLHTILGFLHGATTPESWEYICTVVQILLEAGANINLQDEFRRTPLHSLVVAMLSHRTTISISKFDHFPRLVNLLDILLSYGPDLQICDCYGQTVLSILNWPSRLNHEVFEYLKQVLQIHLLDDGENDRE